MFWRGIPVSVASGLHATHPDALTPLVTGATFADIRASRVAGIVFASLSAGSSFQLSTFTSGNFICGIAGSWDGPPLSCRFLYRCLLVVAAGSRPRLPGRLKVISLRRKSEKSSPQYEGIQSSPEALAYCIRQHFRQQHLKEHSDRKPGAEPDLRSMSPVHHRKDLSRSEEKKILVTSPSQPGRQTFVPWSATSRRYDCLANVILRQFCIFWLLPKAGYRSAPVSPSSVRYILPFGYESSPLFISWNLIDFLF